MQFRYIRLLTPFRQQTIDLTEPEYPPLQIQLSINYDIKSSMVGHFKKRQAVQHYWNYREELAIEDGLIFKAHRLAIPASQRAEYLRDLQAGHLGEEKTLLRVRGTVF